MTNTRRPSKRRPLPRRAGLTFYEVFLAIVILAGSLAVLGRHLAVGRRAATDADRETIAEELATNTLNEVLAGAVPLQPQSGVPLQVDDGLWSWSLELAAGPSQDLLDVRVTVTHSTPEGTPDAAFTLRQWTRDPAVFLDAEAAATGGTP